ncbi:MAG: YggT family protein [Hydrogenothermaceae bacterium]|nr:YggT family protein [Hydrogenothermaceae bacterium]
MIEIKWAVFNLLNTALEIYKWILILSALISFVNPDPYNPVIKFLRSVTEPVYRRIRSVVPTVYYNVDFAPMMVILLIYFVQTFILPYLLL